MVQEKGAVRMHPSRTSIPRELLVESVRQPYEVLIYDVGTRQALHTHDT
jgi:hypothetical protein